MDRSEKDVDEASIVHTADDATRAPSCFNASCRVDSTGTKLVAQILRLRAAGTYAVCAPDASHGMVSRSSRRVVGSACAQSNSERFGG
jgi:hypothetical protein